MSATVNVGKIPGEIFKLPHRRGETVSALLNRADISAPAGAEIQIDGTDATLRTTVGANDTVLVISKIKGN